MKIFAEILSDLERSGNLRRLSDTDTPAGVIDFSTNDYLGLANDSQLHDSFISSTDPHDCLLSASASRLLASRQSEYSKFERLLVELYGREALSFDSGYHANTGLISAIASAAKDTVIIADKLVHASIIDGARLSGSRLIRFRHNDYNHLQRIITGDQVKSASLVLIVAEGVYSMDGDSCNVAALVDAKHQAGPHRTLLYIDEAHSLGCVGPGGLGISRGSEHYNDVDIVVGTLGKAIASVGAFAVMSHTLKDFAVNKARSFIFSTALPPMCVRWSRFVMQRLADFESRRQHLNALSQRLADRLGGEPRYIYPLITGSSHKALELSQTLLQDGIKVLPIRTPTVPPGTERLRISLSAQHSFADIDRLADAINRHL